MKIEHVMSIISKPNTEANIGRNRHFGEVNHGPATASVSLVGGGNNDLQCKEISQEFKKSILASKDSKTSSNLVSVHFAATEESLSLYFSKCGVVEKVVISTDKANALPRRSAYVTFTSKESVDKAVALCGTCFFSRTIKGVRKAEAAGMTTPAKHAPNTYQAPLSYLNRKTMPSRQYFSSSHLQWRRDSASAPSEASAQVSVEGGGINASKQQGFPSSAVSSKFFDGGPCGHLISDGDEH